MTVEELEIIVSAKIEQVKPQIQKVVKEIKNAVKDTNGIGSELLGKIDTTRVAKDIAKVKKQVKEVFDPNYTKGMTINGKKIISGISKSFNQLKGKKIDLGNAIDIQKYQQKVAQLKSSTEQVKRSISNIKSAGYVAYNADAIQKTIDATQPVKTGKTAKLSGKDIKNDLKQSSTHGNKLLGLIKQIRSHLSGAGKNANKLNLGLSGAKNMASKIKGHLKVGLGQIMKIAGSLIGLRAIYSGLQSVANSWLSSQDAQAKQLSANIEYMKFALGSTLRPVIETIVNLIYQALKGVQSLIYALTGVNIFANASAKAYTSMANSAKNAQKATQALADIDEIHNIQENSDSGSSGGSGAPNFDLSTINPMPDFLSKLMDNIKNGNWYEIGASIGYKINETLEKIPWEKIKEKAGNCGKNLAGFINGGVHKTDWKLVGGTLAEGVNTAFSFLGNFLKTADFYSYGKAVSDATNGFFEKVEWDKVGQTLSDGAKGAIDTLAGYIENYDVGKIQDAVLDFLFNIDWAGIFNKLLLLLSKLVIIGIEAPINMAIKSAKALSDKLPPCMRGAVSSLQEIHLEDSILSLGAYTAQLEEVQKQAKVTAKETSSNIGELREVTVKTFDELQNKTFTWGNKTASNYNNGVSSQQSNSNSLFSKFKTMAHDYLNQSYNSKKWGSDTTTNYNNGLDSQQGTTKSIIGRLKDKIRNDLQKSDSYTWGRDMLQGFMNGINSLTPRFNNTVRTIASTVSKFLHFSRPDEGPLRDYETWMPDMIQGLSRTLLDSAPVLDNAVSEVSSQIADNLRATSFDLDVNSNVNKTINTSTISSQLENAVYSAIQKAENLFRLTINNELKVNSKTIAQEIIDDLNNEAKRRGYKPILQRG